MFQHVAICKLLTETKRGTDYTDPVMPIGKLHAVKTLFSCGQALSRAVTRPNRHTTSRTNEGCAIWDRSVPEF